MPLRPGICSAIVFFIGVSYDEAYSQTFKQNVLNIFAQNTSISDDTLPMLSNYLCPLLLLFFWMVSIIVVVCTCLCCKFVKSETSTTYDSNIFEMQEVHILGPDVLHAKACACLECLHRQLAKEMKLKNNT